MLYLLIMIFVQILTESFPISSSATCLLITRMLELFTNIKSLPLATDIDFLMHGPTIVLLGLYFSPSLYWYALRVRTKAHTIIHFAGTCFLAGCVTAVGFVCIRIHHCIDISLATGLSITALLLFLLPFIKRSPTKKIMSYSDALILGVVQALALLPGISRLASTFVAARFLGFYPEHALAYSCAIQVPLLGAAFLKGLYGLYADPQLASVFSYQVVGVAFVATVLSYQGFLWVASFIKRDKIYLFGWYVLFTAFLAYFFENL